MDASAQAQEIQYIHVNQLSPGTDGHNLIVRLVKIVPVVEKKKCDGTTVKIALAILGDHTASIVFTARDEQVDLLRSIQLGDTVEILNGKIEMFDKGFMRLEVDSKWGKIFKSTNQKTESVNPKNLSMTEYELVPSIESQ